MSSLTSVELWKRDISFADNLTFETTYVDNFEIAEVIPEPATLGLLIVGTSGLMLIRHRLNH